MPSSTLYGCKIFFRRGCHSVCLLVRFSQDLSNGRAEADLTLFCVLLQFQHLYTYLALIPLMLWQFRTVAGYQC